MTEAGWLNFSQLDPLMIHALGAKGVPARREGLFACGCLRCACDWRLPDAEADAVEATEQFLDGDLTRPTWRKRRLPIEKRNASWSRRVTQWEREFREAVVNLFYPSPGWGVTSRLLHTIKEISSVHYSAAFEAKLCSILRDVFGNPFRAVAFAPAWRTDTAVSIARGMYESRDFSGMPILADALQDAGCDSDDVLTHCRDVSQVHVRGCWVVDRVLGKA